MSMPFLLLSGKIFLSENEGFAEGTLFSSSLVFDGTP